MSLRNADVVKTETNVSARGPGRQPERLRHNSRRHVLPWIPLVLLPVAAFAQTECVDCHPAIAAELKKPVVHPGGCLACHIDHRAAGAHGAPPYLKARQPALCLGCHEAGAAKLVTAHQGQPFQAAVCSGVPRSACLAQREADL